mmetsp:Transcript_99144/g.171968  ORF Transcript_99144/g.171968 Transcript_99144/m.171968 type:complete len:124 (-) Transcript_99144:805-1176(-)
MDWSSIVTGEPRAGHRYSACRTDQTAGQSNSGAALADTAKLHPKEDWWQTAHLLYKNTTGWRKTDHLKESPTDNEAPYLKHNHLQNQHKTTRHPESNGQDQHHGRRHRVQDYWQSYYCTKTKS